MDIVEKRRGPRTKPRGTAMVRSQAEEEEPSTKTEKLPAGKLRVKPKGRSILKPKRRTYLKKEEL